MINTTDTKDTFTPPYLPFSAFKRFVQTLKVTAVPSQIDRSVMPKMSGTMQSQMISALCFLGMIDQAGKTQPQLEEIVSAYGTEKWKSSIEEYIVPKYSPIIGDLNIETATSSHLNGVFRENTNAEGETVKKSVRFYVKALNEAGIKYSPHFKIREVRGTRSTKKNNPKRANSEHNLQNQSSPDGKEQNSSPNGCIQFPLYLPGKQPGRIVVPEDLSESDCELIAATLDVLRAYAKQVFANRKEVLK